MKKIAKIYNEIPFKASVLGISFSCTDLGGKNMAGKNGRTDRAQERALEYLDYIMECSEELDFVEVTGRAGGDVVTYRIYDDGSMYG